jgi:hypothetical protein
VTAGTTEGETMAEGAKKDSKTFDTRDVAQLKLDDASQTGAEATKQAFSHASVNAALKTRYSE